MSIKLTIIAILVFSYILPFGSYLIRKRRTHKASAKAAFALNALLFFGTLAIVDVLLFSGKVSAAEVGGVTDAAGAGAVGAASSIEGWRYIAAALSTGLSCIGCGIAVASAGSAALGALSENPDIMGKALIFVALAEGIALYGVLISFSLLSA